MIDYDDNITSEELDRQILAIEYVPVQRSAFDKLFSSDEALIKGTVFPELYLPFVAEGGAK